MKVKCLWIKPGAGIYWVLHCYLTFTVNYSHYYLSKKCSSIFVCYFYPLSLIAWLTLIISLGNSGDVKEESLKTVTVLKIQDFLSCLCIKTTACNYSTTFDFVFKNMLSGLTRSRMILLKHEWTSNHAESSSWALQTVSTISLGSMNCYMCLSRTLAENVIVDIIKRC